VLRAFLSLHLSLLPRFIFTSFQYRATEIYMPILT
jgi:hypothetical protein